MKNLIRISLLVLLFSMQPVWAQDLSDEAVWEQRLLPLMLALQAGDFPAVKKHMNNHLYGQNKPLYEGNAKYYAGYLRDYYAGATFTMLSVTPNVGRRGYVGEILVEWPDGRSYAVSMTTK
jgi:hypothetical protein